MNERYSSVSVIVSAFFFFSFLVFFLVGNDGGASLASTVTGATISFDDTNVDDASYEAGDVLSGDVIIGITADDFLPSLYEATLVVHNTTDTIASSTLDIEDLFVDTSITASTLDDGTVGYGIVGEYAADIALFGVALSRPGTYDVELSVDYIRDGYDDTHDVSWEIVIESPETCADDEDCAVDEYCSVYGYCDPVLCREDADCGISVLPYCNLDTYSCVECLDDSVCSDGLSCSPFTKRCRDLNLPEVYEVLFVNDQEGYPLSFVAGDTIACVTNVSLNTVDLTASLYKPGDAQAEPSYTFASANFTCDEVDDTFCWVTQEVVEPTVGQWGCSITAENEYGTDMAISHRALVMGNTPPEQIADIGDLTLTQEVMYDVFDLDDYFTDFENDALGFAWRGEEVSVNIDQDHLVGVRGLTSMGAQEGWIIFTVTDGFTQVDSNIVHVNFSFTPTVGALPSDCVEDWQCGQWSAWQNDMRTRLCTDLAACGTEYTKPAEVQQRTFTEGVQTTTELQLSDVGTSVPVAKTNWWRLMFYLFILVMVTTGAVFLVMYLKKKNAPKKKSPVKTAAKTASKTATGAHPVKVGASQMQQLEKYFFSALAHGEQLPAITQRALKAGWPRANVEQVKRFVSLRQFVAVKLKQGYTESTLRKSLLAKGWKKATLDRVFSMK